MYINKSEIKSASNIYEKCSVDSISAKILIF